MKEDVLKKLESYLEENFKQKNGLLDEIKCFASENKIVDNIAKLSVLFSKPAKTTLSNDFNSGEEENEDISFNLEAWIEEQRKYRESFRCLLINLLKEKGYEKNDYPDFYNKIFMDRRMFSRIMSESYQGIPEKSTIFKLAIGLELDLSNANKLLESAGHCFNCYREFDMIIKFCIENEIYNIDAVDELLYKLGEKTLFSLE